MQQWGHQKYLIRYLHMKVNDRLNSSVILDQFTINCYNQIIHNLDLMIVNSQNI